MTDLRLWNRDHDRDRDRDRDTTLSNVYYRQF